jgi:DNA-binding MarR family transcriptional regulator
LQNRKDGNPSRSSPRRKAVGNDQIERLEAPQLWLLPASQTQDYVESILFLHRSRTAVFGSGIFSDPAWDLLLQLYVAELDHRDRSLSELIKSMATPVSVVTRWITALVEAGIVASTRDPQTGGSLSISLTKDAATKMERLIAQWASELPTR